MSKDKVVSEIYETYDYEKFKPLKENRGHILTGGIKKRKLDTYLKLIEDGEFIADLGTIKVNKDLQIIDGHHRLEALKRHNLPVRYEIIKHENFNESTRRVYLNSVYKTNAQNTAWKIEEMFQAAVANKAPLAVLIDAAIKKYQNNFNWSEVIAILTEDEKLFAGGQREKPNILTFEDKALVERFNSPEFLLELKYFVKLNEKVRVAARRLHVLRSFYTILLRASKIIDSKIFRASALQIPSSYLESNRLKNSDDCTDMFIKYYNIYTKDKINSAAIKTEIKASYLTEQRIKATLSKPA